MGRLRCWLIRGLILAALAGLALGGWVAHGWVSPDAVRDALVAALREQFPEAEVEVGTARLRLFGGITVTDLKLTRRGEAQPFFVAPTALIYHDKPELNRGRLVVRKLELDGPTLRLERKPDGTWSLSGLVKSGAPDQPVPTVVVRNATVFLTDLRPDGLPPLALTQAKFSVLNDPVAVLKIEMVGTAVAGAEGGLTIPLSVSAKLNRYTNTVQAKVEVAELAVGPHLAPALAKLHPSLGEYAANFSAKVAIKADLDTRESARFPTYKVKLDVRDGRWDDPDLPWPVEHLHATLHIQDGRITVEKGAARLGKAVVEFALETRPLGDVSPSLPPTGPRVLSTQYSVLSTQYPVMFAKHPSATADDPLCELEDKLERLDVTVRDLALDDDLFNRLPPKAAKARRMFSPVGAVDAVLKFTRSPGGWRREMDVRPNRLGILYEKFRYPMHDLAGSVKRVTTSDGLDEVRVQVTATAGGRRVELTGKTGTEGPDPLLDLKIAGNDIPIDNTLIGALPPRYAKSLGKLHAVGRADFIVEIRQPQDVNRCENTFRVHMRDGTANYDHFPYPLTKVTGHVLVRVTATDPARPIRVGEELVPDVDTDRVEIREFEAMHAGGRLWISGDSEPIRGSKDRRLFLSIKGNDCPIDADLKAATTKLKLDGLWKTFDLRGKFTFGAHVEIIDRENTRVVPPKAEVQVATAELPGEAGFDPVTDLTLTFNFRGPSITPSFFKYDLDNLEGVLRYHFGKVDLAKFKARHGETTLVLDAAEVRFADGGEVWANIGGLSLRPLVPDDALLTALPNKLRSAFTELKLRGPMDATIKHLVVKANRDDANKDDPVIYWNAELKLAGVSLDTGLEWRDVYGTVASIGRYEGTHLGAIMGNAWFDRATIAKQPLTDAKMTFRVRPQEPDPLRLGQFTAPVIEFPDLTAALYQGTVGGEARIVLDDAIRYRIWLTASGVRLDELARECKLADGGELRGLAQGKILVENLPDPKTGQLVLTGVGQCDVPSGRMYKLPVLLPLLKLMKLQTPDETAFEEAHALFELRGDRVKVTQLDLIGTAVSLGGSGELDTSGDEVRFEFYTVWSQALKRWLTTPLGDVTSFLSGNLFKIEMAKRKGGEMQYQPHMLPAVTDPMRAVAERLRNRLGRPMDPPTIRATGPR